MKKSKTRAEISRQSYLCKNDIGTLLSLPYNTAKRIFDFAMELDKKELPYIIEPRKVRMVSVCKVTGQSLKTIMVLAGGDTEHTKNARN